ncbi:CBS domain-containing protein [Paenibacillus eucommiae]|uniref:CBS domain-containing protein n=1 Tax=Paenibacillus eucommiae TaxID=1355755 RepID=UPI001AE99358|nr:CBS domain-containing protein [Paenibacillus eucommiae]
MYEEGSIIELTNRQKDVLELVRKNAPITGEQIAEMLGISKPTIRTDLSVLVMLGMLDAKPKVGYFPGHALLPEGQSLLKLQELRVKDIQGMPVIVRDTISVHEAVITLFLENVGSLIVADAESTLLGIVSRKDLLKVTLGNPNVTTMPLSLVMTRQPNLITIGPEDTVAEAARKMIHHQVDSLPVVLIHNEAGDTPRVEVVGRITKTGMTRVLLDLLLEH